MQNRTGAYRFTIIILIIDILLLFLLIGVLVGAKLEESNKITLGCWKKVSLTNRSIIIMTNDRDIEEILDTARHEICHEIHYRLNKNNFTNFSKEDKEMFAINCNPEEYLDA